jgi:cholesterol transport system auxiliary component
VVAPHPISYYSLADARDIATPALANAALRAPTLIVSPPHAAAGFDSQRIMYLRQANQLEYFAHNEWIDTPARMLAPRIVTAVASSGAFRAVVQTPSPAAGEMRLDTEILRLQQEFLSAPSRVRFTLRAYLVESATRRVIASRDFDAAVAAASEDPNAGVAAADRAVQTVLEDLSAFCAEAARGARMEK